MEKNPGVYNEIINIFGSIVEIGIMIFVGAASYIVSFLAKVRAGKTFTVFSFVAGTAVAVLMAFFADMLMLGLYPEFNVKLKLAVMIVVGISSEKMFEILLANGIDLLLGKLKSKLGPNLPTP